MDQTLLNSANQSFEVFSKRGTNSRSTKILIDERDHVPDSSEFSISFLKEPNSAQRFQEL